MTAVRDGAHFGDAPFERGNLDAGRLSWLFGREVVPAEDPFDPESYEALLVIDEDRARAALAAATISSSLTAVCKWQSQLTIRSPR